MARPKLPAAYGEVHTGIVELLESARRAAARSVNALMTASYWEIGRRLVEFEQGGRGRAKYGEALVERLAEDLTHRFGRGFSRQNLQQMRAFYLAWPSDTICQTVSGNSASLRIRQTLSGEFIENPQAPTAKSSSPSIVQTPSGQLPDLAALATRFPLPWSAYVRLLAVKSETARAFYEAEALRCGWSVRQLDRQIGSQFHERIAQSKNKAAMPPLRHSRTGGNPGIPRQKFVPDEGKTARRLHPRQSAQWHAVYRRDIGFDQAGLGTQERCRRRVHSKVWCSHAGLLRTACLNGDGHNARKAAQEVEPRLEVASDRGTQSRLAGLVAGNLRLIHPPLPTFPFAPLPKSLPSLRCPVSSLRRSVSSLPRRREPSPAHALDARLRGHDEVRARYALDNLPNKVLAAEYRTVLPNEKLIAEGLERSRRELEARRLVKPPMEGEA